MIDNIRVRDLSKFRDATSIEIEIDGYNFGVEIPTSMTKNRKMFDVYIKSFVENSISRRFSSEVDETVLKIIKKL